MANEIHPEPEGAAGEVNESPYEQDPDDEVNDAISLSEWVDNERNYKELEQIISEDQDAEKNYFQFQSEDFSSRDFLAKNTNFDGKLSAVYPKVLFLRKSNKSDPTRLENSRKDRCHKSVARLANSRWLSLLLFGMSLSPSKEMILNETKTRHNYCRFLSSPTMIRSPDNKKVQKINGHDVKGFWMKLKALGCIGINSNMVTNHATAMENSQHLCI